MTKSWELYQFIIQMLNDYRDCKRDLMECAGRINLVNLKLYGRPLDALSLTQFGRGDLEIFLGLCLITVEKNSNIR